MRGGGGCSGAGGLLVGRGAVGLGGCCRGGRDPARGEQWASVLWQALMPKGAEKEERRAACQRCACCVQEGLRRALAESEGRRRKKQQEENKIVAKVRS